jgi:signal peptidase I
MRTRHTRKLVASALGLIVLGCLWFWFAPVALGGSTNYVVTDGVSMKPRFHTGDLAIVRSQSSYHVGEIVAYNNRMLGTIVLHRIIARAGSRYIFKGDNNHFVDFEHPVASQLVGALWLHIPSAGADLQSIRSPALIGVLVAVGVLLLTGAAFTQRRRRRHRQRRAGGNAQPPPRRLAQDAAARSLGVLAIGLLALLPFVVLALLAFTRPPTAAHPYTIPYNQSGTLSYSAAAAPGPAYPGGRAVTGDPLFTHVVSAVEFRFGYRLHAAARHSLTGRASLEATVASTSGWQRTLELAAPTHFHGDRALVTGTLDLTSLLALIHSVETTTKVSGSYTLTILPHVSATGSLDAVPLHSTFSPRIQFSLTQLEAQPVITAGSSPASGPAVGQSPASLFAPSASGAVTGRRSQPLSLSFGVARLSVATARTIALGAIAIIVCVLLASLVLVKSRPRDEAAAIRARYGRAIVPVARVRELPGVAVIDVADMEALARIAEHYDRSILHETAGEGEAFWVTDESGQFRYAVGASARAVNGEVVDHGAVGVSAHAANGEAVVPGAPDDLVNDVYTEELKLGGALSVSETQVPAATVAANARAGGFGQRSGPAPLAG